MPTIYMHIGAPKTATSTLQTVLARKTRTLLKRGVLYPRTLRHAKAHHALVCDLIEKYQGNRMPDAWYGVVPRGEAWQLLREEIEHRPSNVDAVVVSSELFFGQGRYLKEMLQDIALQLEGYTVKVIVYLRRQDQLYSSFYNQDVKGMRQWGASAYEFYETHQMLRSDYHAMLVSWSDAFGKENIVLRPFEVGQWPEGDVVQDFCRCLGMETIASRYKDKNESLGMTQLYLKRCLNRVGFDKEINSQVIEVLTKLCPEEPVKNCLYIHRGLYRQYRERWIAVNEHLSNDYLNGKPLFNEPIPKPPEQVLYAVDEESLVACIRRLMKVFGAGRFRKHRKLFARAGLLALAEYDLWDELEPAQRSVLLGWL
ncbi:MAG: hypothetical protein HRT77_08105 [Halioglobus sp.]|nr:hypothetical protein [Halioglobus sp.]